jgi:hypothetical protein
MQIGLFCWVSGRVYPWYDEMVWTMHAPTPQNLQLRAAALEEKGWSSANVRFEKKSEKAAAILNAKPRTVESAANVLKSGIPALVQAVSSGDVSVSAGEIVAKMPVEEQARIVANGKDAIVQAASQARKTKKAAANKLRAVVETSRANEQQSTVEEDASVGLCNGSDIEGTVTTPRETDSKPIEGNIDQLTPTEVQLVNFIRRALKTGATWVIAGKGVFPELQTDWLVHKVYDEDLLHVSEQKYDHEQKESAEEVRDPAEVAGAGEPKIDANPEPATVPHPLEKPQVEPALKEALVAAADQYFRVKKDKLADDYWAMKAAKEEAVECYSHRKGEDPTFRDSVFISKWRKMVWWPQTLTTWKEREQFFATIRERLETGDRLKYDPSKKLHAAQKAYWLEVVTFPGIARVSVGASSVKVRLRTPTVLPQKKKFLDDAFLCIHQQ